MMIEKLLDSIGVAKELKIAVFSACLAVISMYFICDKIIFSDRLAVLNQYKDQINDIKSINKQQEEKLGEYYKELNQKNVTISELSKEILRLQPYEPAIQEWRKALDDERAKYAQLQEQLNREMLSTKEIKQNADSCTVERNELRTGVAKLNDVVSSYAPLVGRRNELREVENSKNIVESKIAELESNSFDKQFQSDKLEQLKRISAEYQQQLIQLRKCSK